MEITKDIIYVGVNDRETDLFEGQYRVPNGMAYNSYVIKDRAIAVLDTVDAKFSEEWLQNVESACGGASPDYLIIHHMEPDHSANIAKFKEKYKNAVIVSTDKAFVMMGQFFGCDYTDKRIVVKEGDTLSLGEHTLTFFTAPMVHWPEVMVSYDSRDKVLFSADAFGKFGALDADEEWDKEARRYYFGIVGKYGQQAKALLKKASWLEINTICALHGPILKENLSHYISLYEKWTAYEPEREGVLIAYTSVYGNTKKAAELLFDKIKSYGTEAVLVDLARCDMSEAVMLAFMYDRLVLATTTYNADIFPPMREFIHELLERGFRDRKIAFIENGSWAPMAIKKMKALFENSKNLEYAENSVSIRSAMNSKNAEEAEALAKELV